MAAKRAGLTAFAAALAGAAWFASGAAAQTVKIGFIVALSGPQAEIGQQMQRAVELYAKQHEKELPVVS